MGWFSCKPSGIQFDTRESNRSNVLDIEVHLGYVLDGYRKTEGDRRLCCGDSNLLISVDKGSL